MGLSTMDFKWDFKWDYNLLGWVTGWVTGKKNNGKLDFNPL
jgi:hypothetical protein